MVRTTLNLLLLVAAAVLVVVGVATYPTIPGSVLAGIIVTAALMVATAGRTAAGVTR